MKYAIELTETFLAAFRALDVVVQAVILDDVEGIAERLDAPDASLRPTVEWHHHVGAVDGRRFDVVTWIAVDRRRQQIVGAMLFDLSPID